MDEFVRLPLKTADGRPLIHKYRRHREAPSGLLAVFPGNLYGVDGPLLFYPGVWLWEHGWDLLAVCYGFQTGEPEAGGGMAAAFGEAEGALRSALGQADYPRLGLLGKSFGAVVVAQLCAAMADARAGRAVYLTPPLGLPAFDNLFLQTSQPAHLIQGTADSFYDEKGLDRIRAARPFTQTVIRGADHSLVLAGDPEGTIAALKRACSDVVDFLIADD
jgi:hypothetical protein